MGRARSFILGIFLKEREFSGLESAPRYVDLDPSPFVTLMGYLLWHFPSSVLLKL